MKSKTEEYLDMYTHRAKHGKRTDDKGRYLRDNVLSNLLEICRLEERLKNLLNEYSIDLNEDEIRDWENECAKIKDRIKKIMSEE